MQSDVHQMPRLQADLSEIHLSVCLLYTHAIARKPSQRSTL
jgi:hypothetical protein